jgi:hypothetical protein
MLGHSTSAFTTDVYTKVAEELGDAAASAIAALRSCVHPVDGVRVRMADCLDWGHFRSR